MVKFGNMYIFSGIKSKLLVDMQYTTEIHKYITIHGSVLPFPAFWVFLVPIGGTGIPGETCTKLDGWARQLNSSLKNIHRYHCKSELTYLNNLRVLTHIFECVHRCKDSNG